MKSLKLKSLLAATALGLSSHALADLGSIHVSVYAGDVGLTNPIHQTNVPVQDNGCIDIYSAIPEVYRTYEGGFGLYDHHIGFKFTFETDQPVPLYPAFYDAKYDFLKADNFRVFSPALNTLTLQMEARRVYQTTDVFNRPITVKFTDAATRHGFSHQNRFNPNPMHSSFHHFEGITQRHCALHFVTLQNETPVIANKQAGIQFSPVALAQNFTREKGSEVDLTHVVRGAKVGSQFVALDANMPLSKMASPSQPKDKLGIAFLFPAEEVGVYRILRRSVNGTLRGVYPGTLPPDVWIHVNSQDLSIPFERQGEVGNRGSSWPFHITESGLYHIRIVSHFEYRDRAPTLLGIFRPADKFAENAAHADFFMQFPDGRIEPITSDMMYIPKDAL